MLKIIFIIIGIIMIYYDEVLEENMIFTILIFFLFGHILLIYCSCNDYILKSDQKDKIYNNDATITDVNSLQVETKTQRHIPYEEKYLEKVRAMKNEYVFTTQELELQERKLYDLLEEENSKKLEATYILNEKIDELIMKIKDLDIGLDVYDYKKDSSIMKKIYDSMQTEISSNQKELAELNDNSINMDELKEKAKQYIIDEQLKRFNNKYIIEYTPLGNVLMFYNHDKLAFEYYSDLTIPYRYLECVARKYVLTYNYRPLYIDMEEELKDYEKKLQEKEAELLQQKKDSVMGLSNNDSNMKSITKDVFAKFKSYNKEAGTGRVNTAPPPKNSIPQNRINNNLNDSKKDGGKEKMLLKENANRYSYQGKFLNFNILQKIDKKKIDKNYALTFAEFKKMNKLEDRK